MPIDLFFNLNFITKHTYFIFLYHRPLDETYMITYLLIKINTLRTWILRWKILFILSQVFFGILKSLNVAWRVFRFVVDNLSCLWWCWFCISLHLCTIILFVSFIVIGELHAQDHLILHLKGVVVNNVAQHFWWWFVDNYNLSGLDRKPPMGPLFKYYCH